MNVLNQYEKRINHLKENKAKNLVIKKVKKAIKEENRKLEQNFDDITTFFKFLDHKTYTVFHVFLASVDKTTTSRMSYPSKAYFIPANNIKLLLDLCNQYKLTGQICLGINERPNKQTKLIEHLPKINIILFDIDVRKNKKINGLSPDNLKKEAYEVVLKCKQKLEELGFTVDLLIDSGNGYHVYIKVNLDIPSYNTKEEFEETSIYKRLVFLEEQLKQFNTKNVEIDNISKDVIRRVKIPGTYNIKRYKNPTDKKFKVMNKDQWRRAKILYLNENINETQNNTAFMNLPLDYKAIVKKKDLRDVFKPGKAPDITKIRLKEFKKLLEKDEKLQKLYNCEITFGDTKKHDFKSRSEAELSLIIKLMYYNIHHSHIREIMKTCKIGKWKETGDAYKITTMRKASDFVKNHPKTIDKKKILQLIENIPKDTTETKKIIQFFKNVPLNEPGIVNYVINILGEKLDNFTKPDLKKIIKRIKEEKKKEEGEDLQIERMIANYILNQNIIYTLIETDELCLYKEGRFIYGAGVKAIIRTQITNLTENIEDYEESKAKRSMIFEFIKSQSFCSVNEFDCNDNVVNLINGLYNFEDNMFIPHDPNNPNPYKSFIQLPIEYNSNAKCPTTKKFFTEVFGPERVSLMDEWFAYLMMNTVKYHKALMLYGPTDTGETTFLQLVYAFLGWKHISGVSLQDLWRPFQISNLRDTLANIHDDLDTKTISYIGMFKKIVTNMYLTGEIKNVQDYVDWLNRTKLMFACNRLPKPKDVGDDFWRRWILLPCFNQFIKGINRDSDMLIKITTPEELSGLFNQAIEGWKRLEERGGFPEEWDNIERIKDIWLMDINPVSAFVDKYCNIGNPEYEVDYELFYKKVCDYRKKHQVKEISKNICTRSLGRIDERIKTKKVSKKYHPETSGHKYIYIEFKEEASKKLNFKKKKEKLIIEKKKEKITDFIEVTPDKNDFYRAKILAFFNEKENKFCYKDAIIQVLKLDYEKDEKLIIQIFDNMVKEKIIQQSPKGYRLNPNFID